MRCKIVRKFCVVKAFAMSRIAYCLIVHGDVYNDTCDDSDTNHPDAERKFPVRFFLICYFPHGMEIAIFPQSTMHKVKIPSGAGAISERLFSIGCSVCELSSNRSSVGNFKSSYCAILELRNCIIMKRLRCHVQNENGKRYGLLYL